MYVNTYLKISCENSYCLSLLYIPCITAILYLFGQITCSEERSSATAFESASNQIWERVIHMLNVSRKGTYKPRNIFLAVCLSPHVEENSHERQNNRNQRINTKIAQPRGKYKTHKYPAVCKKQIRRQGSTKAATVFDRHQHVFAWVLNHVPALPLHGEQQGGDGGAEPPGFKDIWEFG